MAFQSRERSLRSVLWAGASFAVALIGLFTAMHESAAHGACAAAVKGIAIGVNHAGLNCGFSDTSYWAGIVICLAGFLSLIATAGSAISTETKARALSRTRQGLSNRRNASGQIIDPTDPATRWRLDPATNWRPGPAGWHAGPSAAAPFVPPVRHPEDAGGSAFGSGSNSAEDLALEFSFGTRSFERRSPRAGSDACAS